MSEYIDFIKKRIRELEEEKNKFEGILNILSGRKNKSQNIDEAKYSGETSSEAPVKKSVLYFTSVPQDGTLIKGTDTLSNKSVYKIEYIIDKGELNIANTDSKSMKKYIANQREYFPPATCDISSVNQGKKVVITPGKVHLDGDKWIVDEKVKIEIV